MSDKNKDNNNEDTTSWPGVLDEIDIEVIPVEYVKTVEMHFEDGTTWIIDLDENEKEDSIELEDSIESLIDEYEDSIKGVNFILDVEKVKRDITNRTHLFMKKRR